MSKVKLGVIGGSGIYEIDGVHDGQWKSVETPFGRPSDEIYTGVLNDVDVAFIPRHGRGHVHNPSNVPYLANVCALKILGVTDVIALSACGSLKEDLKPGDFVLVDQYIDNTYKREKTFFSRECVAHVSLADPVCNRMVEFCKEAMENLQLNYHPTGTYITMEGPQFSTKAESQLYREKWGCDVIGMTNMPEAKLAREAEICYASVAMVTDFDCWHPDHENVEVADIITTLSRNASAAKNLIIEVTKNLSEKREKCEHGCDHALEYAIITNRSNISLEEQKILNPIAGRLFKRNS
ncbi:MAG: S-methyl-5'-thioadenosine phosphorylase [Rhodospirillaceae bacterium]|nr:S-methyl-5'-thioadenosine phosphorylase [Rhodospirillaceae bacterium]|tara:strand:- start:3510 stop:4394 length:885 start_codon:yes stop_codon:yes gene_type:complete